MKPTLELQLEYEKNPQDIHKEIHIILSVTSVKRIRSLCWAVKISSIRKVKEISNF